MQTLGISRIARGLLLSVVGKLSSFAEAACSTFRETPSFGIMSTRTSFLEHVTVLQLVVYGSVSLEINITTSPLVLYSAQS